MNFPAKLADAQAAAVENTLTQPETTQEPETNFAGKVRRPKRKTTEPEAIGPAVDAVVQQAVEQQAASREPGNDEPEVKKPLPILEIRGWSHDNQAGVELLTYTNRDPLKKRFEAWLKFREGKPSEEVRQYMKDNGFKWHPDAPEAGMFKGEGAWAFPIGYQTGAQDRINSQRVYNEVVDMTLKEKGIERQQEGFDRF